jgi:hypothetical protein
MGRACSTMAMAVWLTASTAAAQSTPPTPTLTVTPANAARWDTYGHLTWLGRRQHQSFDPWYEVATGGATVGYHWTPHLKAELDVSTSTRGQTYSVEPVPPFPAVPSFVTSTHEFRLTTVATALNAQFFENTWFHPFVGAGIELTREREHIERTTSIVIPRDPRAPPTTSPPRTETKTRYVGRPFVGAGFKVYVSERAFIRTDLRTSWSSDGLTTMAWRNGIGFDF